MRTQFASLGGLIAVVGLLYLFDLGGAPLWDRDEPRNAGCTREMLARNDWVAPHFNGELRTHKPVLLYWLMMVSYGIFGDNEFAARLVSAVMACGTVAITWDLGRRMASHHVGTWAGLALGTSLLFTMSARAATPDACLIFFSTLSLWFVLPRAAGAEPCSEESQPIWPWLGSYAAMGCAMLAKGPVGIVLPAAVLFLSLAAEAWSHRTASGRDQRILAWISDLPRKILAMRPVWAVAVLCLVAGPWYAWVGLRTDGAWLAGFFGEHNVGRALRSMEGHGGFFGFYPLSLLVGFFPWSVLSIPLGLDLWARWRRGSVTSLDRCCLIWASVYLLAFSCARTQLPSYLLPAYPAVALLVGDFVARWSDQRAQVPTWWATVGFATLSLVGLGIGGGFYLAAERFLPAERGMALIGLVPFAMGIAGAVVVHRLGVGPSMVGLAASAWMTHCLVFGVATHRIGSHQVAPSFFAEVRRAAPDAPLVAIGELEPSWVYYAHRPIVEFAEHDEARLRDFLEQRPNAVVITSTEDLPVLRELAWTRILGNRRDFLENDRIIAWRREAQGHPAEGLTDMAAAGRGPY